MEAFLWLDRSTPRARGPAPEPPANGAWTLPTIGGLAFYRSTPVGPYREIFAASLLLGRGLRLHIPFMAVDSKASVVGGRANWALPKVEARFSDGGAPRGGTTVHVEDGTELSLAVTVRGRRLPLRASIRCVQVWPDGEAREFTLSLRGRASLAVVEVQRPAPRPPGGWIWPGRHPGLLVSGRLVIGPSRRTRVRPLGLRRAG